MMQSEFITTGFKPAVNEVSSFSKEKEVFNFKLLRGTPVNAAKATKDFTEFVLTAVTPGVAGNAISLTLVEVVDATQELSIGVDPTDEHGIVVLLAKAEDAVTTTGTLLVAALNDDDFASSLVVASGTGTDALEEMDKTALAGGVDGTTAHCVGIHYIDDTYVYLATDVNGPADSNWKKLALA